MSTQRLWITVVATAVTMAAACGGGEPGGPTFPEEHPRIYLPGERDRLVGLLAAEHPAAVRFKAAVDGQVDGADHYAFEAWMVALMGQLTGEPQYCAFAVADVDAKVAAEEARIADGDLPAIAGDSYLEVGPRVGDLALTYDFCADVVTGTQRLRWLIYADQAVWNVWHPMEASWGGQPAPWTGWSVDNPSNNYYYSFLRATMLLGLATHGEAYEGLASGDDWLTMFRDTKLAGQLVPTFAADLVGGGSREGTGYGVAMHRLFELYALWQGSTGEAIADLTPHARASLLQFMHATVPTLDRYAPTGDQSRDSTAMMFDYQRNYVASLAALHPADPLAARAQSYLAACSVPEMGQRFMLVYDFFFALPDLTPTPLDGLATANYAPGVGELFVRSGWDEDATWWNLIAGPYTESHAHRDQGSLMLFKGEWLAVDAVIGSRSGLRQEEEAHNLVRFVDGDGATIRQRFGTASSLTALARGDGWTYAGADLTPAYGGDSEVRRSEREVIYVEPDVLIVFDRADSEPGTTAVWHLSSPLAPSIAGDRATFAGAAHAASIGWRPPPPAPPRWSGPRSTATTSAATGSTSPRRAPSAAASSTSCRSTTRWCRRCRPAITARW
ncbi:MAG: hypothetical protein R2939_14625 [Kofleriaceae bacterium]